MKPTEEQKAAYTAYIEAGKALVKAMQPMDEGEIDEARESMRDYARYADAADAEVAAFVYECRDLDEEG